MWGQELLLRNYQVERTEMTSISQHVVARHLLKTARRPLPIAYKTAWIFGELTIKASMVWTFAWQEKLTAEDIADEAEALAVIVSDKLSDLSEEFIKKVYAQWPDTEIDSVYLNKSTENGVELATGTDGLNFRCVWTLKPEVNDRPAKDEHFKLLYALIKQILR